MMDTKRSIWMTGTYEMLMQRDAEGAEGDLSVTIFAKAADPEDTAADEDAPVLEMIDVWTMDLGLPAGVPGWKMGLRDIGEHGLTPEAMEAEYGARMAQRLALLLFEAADRDLRGVDSDDMPFREPQPGAMAICRRAAAVFNDLTRRLGPPV